MKKFLDQRFSRVAMSAAVASLALAAMGSALVAASAAASSVVVSPSQVGAIVANDTTLNNKANGSLSITLQDSHESCLQDLLDDATFRGEQAVGSKNLGSSFNQIPSRAFVPRETSYPAFFSVLAENRTGAQAATTSLLTYVKTSASRQWTLSAGSEILGPTTAGVAVPAVATDKQGFATSLETKSTDDLRLAPDKVAGAVAEALTKEAVSGKLPAGFSAQFGPNKIADPHASNTAYSGLGTVSTTYTAVFPSAASRDEPSSHCPYPAYRLSNGGALVVFPMFEKVHVAVRDGEAVVQPSDRSTLGLLLAPGTYSSFTLLFGDMAVAVVPPAGSTTPIEVIGQATEGLSGSGVSMVGAPSSNASGGPPNAGAIANTVDPGLVDIDTTLNAAGEGGAGTGMVLTSNGEVLTNNHVIEGELTLSVTDIGNGKTYGAKVLGYSRSNDIAVLQLVGASGLHTVSPATATTLQPRLAVIGIGNAGGRGGTPSYAGGVITALDQSITANDQADGTSEQLSGLIQTNADIEPGDSGGPLVNANGKVIGMNSAASSSYVFEQGGAATSQGFAIPIATALGIAKQITSGHKSSTTHIGPTAFLGTSVVAPGSTAFGGFGKPVLQPTVSGALIESVVAGSPAAKAGLAAGDTITSVAGHRISSPSALTAVMVGEKPTAVVSVVFLDLSGGKHTVSARLSAGPPQ